jgi:hypothetical protein
MAEFHFWSIEASNIESDVTIQFLVGGLVIHFAGIFHLSCSIQKLFKNFMLLQQLRNFSILGANMTLNFFANLETPKGTSLRKSASIEALWSRWLFPFGAVGVRKNKEKVNTSGNCIFHAYGEQTPLNRLLSFLHIT